jgi:hypothetical protein
MTKPPTFKLTNPNFATFFDANPDFDLLTHDFFCANVRSKLNGDAIDQTLEALRPYQRLLRVVPPQRLDIGPSWAGVEPIIEGLIKRDLRGAHEIAALAPHQFEKRTADLFGGDRELPKEIHRRAVQVKAAARHLFANVRDVAGSPLTRAGLPSYAEPELVDYFQNLPSYQSLFGSLDYIEVPHCASIFSPAAYFLDLMRITNDHITDYNNTTIPPGYKLDERRSDLFDHLKLSCEKTSELVPSVSLVLKVLETKLTKDLGKDPYLVVATAPYPFNLPFNRPLSEVNVDLDRLSTSLIEIGRQMFAAEPAALGFGSSARARAYLKISAEQVEELTTVNIMKETIGAQFGVANIEACLPKTGEGTISFETKKNVARGAGLGDKLSVGQSLESKGQIRTVIRRVDDSTVEVDLPFVETGVNATWIAYGFPVDLTLDSTFRQIVGGMSYDDLHALVDQRLTPHEIKNGEADKLFINHTKESLAPPIEVKRADALKGNVGARLVNLSPARLDRMSRFIRLSRLSGIEYTTLDWLMRVGGFTEITPDLLILIASIKQLAEATKLEVATVAAFIGPFKTTGRGDGPFPTDPFDVVFNPPSLLNGNDPSTTPSPIPFDLERKLAWAPEGIAGDHATGELVSGSKIQVVLSSKASNQEGAYDGLQIAIAKSSHGEEYGIIKTYEGTSRTATLYAALSETPVAGAPYKISNAIGLEDRLVSALRVGKTHLASLGAAYKKANSPNSTALLLNLETLTGLWRLAKVASIYRLPVDEYLIARSLDNLNLVYKAKPVDAMADIQSAIRSIELLRQVSLNAYELDYVLKGTPSRFVRPAFDLEDVPRILTELESSAKESRLTVDTLTEAGFDSEEAQRLVTGLQVLGLIDKKGLIAPHDDSYFTASSAFPVTEEELSTHAAIDSKEAKATIDTLVQQTPTVLETIDDKSWALTASHGAIEPLDRLFVSVRDGGKKRLAIARYVAEKATLIALAETARLFPVAAITGFQTARIGPAQSKAIFDSLTGIETKVLLPASGVQPASDGWLSATYQGNTEEWTLFTSEAQGQSGVISAYDPETRNATISSPWPTSPDAFTYYQITRSAQTGSAKGAAANTLTLSKDASTEDGAYVGFNLLLTSGPSTGEIRSIIEYKGLNRSATLSQSWSTVPAQDVSYEVQRILLAGNADGGSLTSILLGRDASNQPDDYLQAKILLIADPDAQGKTTEVRDILDAVRSQQKVVLETLAASAQAQEAATLSGIVDVLATTNQDVLANLSFATSTNEVRLLVPVFLGGDSDATCKTATGVLEGLSRFSLLRTKMTFQNSVWTSITRQPKLFNINNPNSLTSDDLRMLASFKDFVGTIGDDGTRTSSYLEIWPNVVDRFATLFDLTGWPQVQVEALDTFIKKHDSKYPGSEVLAGLLRLASPFALSRRISGDANFLMAMATLLNEPALGSIGGEINAEGWARLNQAAQSSKSAVAVRYNDQSFSTVADNLQRGGDSRKRDIFCGYLIWKLSKQPATQHITSASDLFQYLLIDVEMGGCDTTSPIAQAINSVQLYMQRCRMGLEPGVIVDHIPTVWWQWMSEYRVWEANRKIFLYPENYLVPSQRPSATPEFRNLGDKMMQSRPTEKNVAAAMIDYFDAFEGLAGLIPVGGSKADQTDYESGQVDETGIIVGRSNTSPPKYYLRKFTRTTIPDNLLKENDPPLVDDWEPWTAIDASIDALFVTPVWSFGRPFLFWNEVEEMKSSTIVGGGNGSNSSTQSTWLTTTKYSFPNSAGSWISPQDILGPMPIRVAPYESESAENKNLKKAFEQNQHYWTQPFAQAFPAGLPGTGRLTFVANQSKATGQGTRLGKQVKAGDFIVVWGQKVQVSAVDDAGQTLTTATEFRVGAKDVAFKVIPGNPNQKRFAPYKGSGGVRITLSSKVVNGLGTTFKTDFRVGDFILVGAESRTVVQIESDTRMLVSLAWGPNSPVGNKTTITFTGLGTVSGDEQRGGRSYIWTGQGTAFQDQARIMDDLIVDSNRYQVTVISDQTRLESTGPIKFLNEIKDSAEVGNPNFSNQAYQLRGEAYDYVVVPIASGDETLLVSYGPNLDIQTEYGPLDKPDESNASDDPFIAATYEYDLSLYKAGELIKAVKVSTLLSKAGDITSQQSLVLNGSLTPESLRLFSAVSTAESTSPTFRLGVDRENHLLFAGLMNRPLVSVYWGNSTPSTTANQQNLSAQDRPVLFHTSSDSATLLGMGNQIGWYLFNNKNDYFLITAHNSTPVPLGFGGVLEAVDASSRNIMLVPGPHTLDNTTFDKTTFRLTRLSTDVAGFLKQRLLVSLDTALSLESQFLPEHPINQYFKLPQGAAPETLDPTFLPSDTMSFTGAHGIYFWEMFYHSPMFIAEWLKSNNDFAQAKRWYEYVFNPNAPTGDLVTIGNRRYWRFRPFRENMSNSGLKEILSNEFETRKANNDPFDPHAIAKLRISAYGKSSVLRYIDNLIRWADSLFTADTHESITQAQNLYLLAHDLMGRRPEAVGVFKQPDSLTFNEIKAKYPHGGIPQYLIDLENTPFLPATGQAERFANVPVNDVHAYFGVPDNRELLVYWDTIADRLYKIRNCMNINGVVRQLALFAPPLDPAALVTGFGASGTIAGGAGYLAYPIPNYRFTFLIQMAKSLTDQVMSFGDALLSALDRRDSEALAQLQFTQQAQLLQLGTEIKNQNIVQIDDQAEVLQEALNSATARVDHYKTLIAQDVLPEEVAEIAMMSAAAALSGASSVLGAAASVASAMPNIGSPFAMTYGGQQLGASLQNASAWTAVSARVLETTSNILGIMVNHKRNVQDWELQKTLAEFDERQFQAQIDANAVQKVIAERDLQMHLTEIDQTRALQDFFRNKFTNEALFAWIAGRLSTTYFQSYVLALEVARMAQRAYQFEYRTETSFIAATYWDDLRKGLTAGQTLSQSLSMMETSYVRSNVRLQEITKTVSLRQQNPVAFLELVRTGETHFELPESLFDEDFPGHYRRLIKTITVSVPALVGPYQNIHATLTQTANRVVLSPDPDAVKFLLGEDVEVPEGNLEHNIRAYQNISISRAQGDSGLFTLNSDDPMYLPFEQTGAVSSWRLSMPKSNNRISYESLSDVILEIQYTALDGGTAFRDQVAHQLRERHWRQLIQPANQYQLDWSRFMTGPVKDQTQTLQLDARNLVLPNIDRVTILGFYVFLDVTAGTTLVDTRNAYLTLTASGSEPMTVLPSADGSAMALFDRPVTLKSTASITASFDLREGYTPAGLRVGGDRLDPTVLRDLDIVLFLSGVV